MKAAVLYEKFQPLQVEELTLDAPGPREALVKLAASGVCHSDLHYIKGDREHPMPVVLGHEGAGIVEEVGSGVTYATMPAPVMCRVSKCSAVVNFLPLVVSLSNHQAALRQVRLCRDSRPPIRAQGERKTPVVIAKRVDLFS